MWARASSLSDDQLTSFVIQDDLVETRAGSTSYGTIGEFYSNSIDRPHLDYCPVFGRIRIPELKDEEGEGFIHVRYVARCLTLG